jgi:hypothetical protein
VKSEYYYKPVVIDKIAGKLQSFLQGNDSLELKKYLERDQGIDILRARENVKKIQQEYKNDMRKISNSDQKETKKLITNTKI